VLAQKYAEIKQRVGKSSVVLLYVRLQMMFLLTSGTGSSIKGETLTLVRSLRFKLVTPNFPAAGLVKAFALKALAKRPTRNNLMVLILLCCAIRVVVVKNIYLTRGNIPISFFWFIHRHQSKSFSRINYFYLVIQFHAEVYNIDYVSFYIICFS